mgnify:CR=1 FL=1
MLKDLEQVKAVRVELDGQAFLLRTELPGRAYEAFQAVGVRPPLRREVTVVGRLMVQLRASYGGS